MHSQLDEVPELNITPLVDIMLVLLAILMVTTPALVYEEVIKLPDGSKSSVVNKLPELEIRITKDRKVYLKNDSFMLSEFADSFMMQKSKYPLKSIVYIKADEGLSYKDVMFVLKTVKQSGFTNISLETNG
ncbi:ExbD/TolR family protein [Sulfurospirillum deleyianum]|uniref:Biopolymer transport protein ExbD/TolR n=1 Tax=Sulfurospirillum deleyianum (strain ATCC 51133 / DSM 6946 / 5175) TaxID=525898 RepID=D1AZT8_SULD5|nr:biopolymer transporter ExbD [Sulfurospirillum deleyianum]ACZ11555.1 Biopolymer transport protein ExbD/TolR [Sulfurospirillum deleyianum DSM 6946]